MPVECTKPFSGQGSALNPAVAVYSAPRIPLAGRESGWLTLLKNLPPLSTIRASPLTFHERKQCNYAPPVANSMPLASGKHTASVWCLSVCPTAAAAMHWLTEKTSTHGENRSIDREGMKWKWFVLAA